MAIYHEDIVDIELESGNIHRSFAKHSIGSGDAAANRFGVRVLRAGVAVALLGVTCQGYFHNANGENIALTSHGTVADNVAYVTLPQACYNVEGNFTLSIKLVGGGVTGTMRIVDGVVDNTGTTGTVAPTSTVPTYQEIIAQYDEMVDATASAVGAQGAMKIPVTWREGYYIDGDGNYVSYGEFNASEKIPVYDSTGTIKRNIYIKVRLNTAAFIAFYDKDGELIVTETTDNSSGNPIYETDTNHVEGCCYVAVSALVHYDPVIIACFTETDIGGMYDNTPGKGNLFDPYDTRTQVGKYIDNTGAIVDITSEYAVSHPIKVKGGVAYKYHQPANKFGAAAHYLVCDAFGNIIAARTGQTISNNTVTFTESGSCYVMVNISLSQTGRDFFRICEAAVFADNHEQYHGRLTGKFISYNGDSICESRTTGYASNGGGYPLLISQITGSIYENRAVSGGTLAANDTYHSVCEDIENMDDDADIICLEGGINDYWQHIQLGDYSVSDFTGTVDEDTVCGALESIFRQAINKWVGKPIVFIIIHKVTTTAWTQNNAGYTFADAREKMIGICNKYSIPYLDMWAEGGLNAYMSALNTAYLNGGSNTHPDGCHPDVNGYKKYYVPRLISLFESLLPYDD